MNSQEEQEVQAKVEQVRGRLQDLNADLRVVDDEVESLAPQRTHHELLEQACGSLEKLGQLGAASLFWGEGKEPAHFAEQLRAARSRVSGFQAHLGKLDARRQEILSKIGREEGNLQILGEDLYDVREAEERRKREWIVERDISPVPARVQLMAWARGGEEDKLFHKTLGASLLIALPLAVLFPMIKLPLPERIQPKDMPTRLVQLIRQERAKPIPTPPAVPEKPPEKTRPEQPKPNPAKEAKPSKPDQSKPEGPPPGVPEPKPSEQPGQPGPEGTAGPPQMKIGKVGLLAFKDKFASLAKDKVDPRLGADARYNTNDDSSKASTPARSMLTTNAPGSSGGINLASLSRSVGGGGGGGGGGALGGEGGGGGGGGLQGVRIGRATSSIASIGGGDRPLARGGPGPSRTDEEIQIVFDRYKAQFYRLYNRALRDDPSLRGQMVLRLTIEPDGSVSMCRLQSSDMNAPDLATQVVHIVLTINFGAKEGVQALTIVYPIDFLPAS